jgi:hypothetical protein
MTRSIPSAVQLGSWARTDGVTLRAGLLIGKKAASTFWLLPAAFGFAVGLVVVENKRPEVSVVFLGLESYAT